MKKFKVLIEFNRYNEEGKFEGYENKLLIVEANDIDEIEEEFIREKFGFEFDFDVVMVCDYDKYTDDEIYDIYHDICMCARFYEKYDKPITYKKNSFGYYLKPGCLKNIEPDKIIIYINDRIKVVNPDMTYSELDRFIQKEFNEEIKDIKVYYIFSKNIETENDVICIDEWARYVS
jgi:hypothetical protein